MAIGPMLIYGAGGLALSDSKLDVIGYRPPDIDPARGTATLVGFSIGAGAEYALTAHALVRAEYLFHDYGHKASDIGSGPPNDWQDRELDQKTQTVRLAVGCKF
jgi:outer membrane immunogenic protein